MSRLILVAVLALTVVGPAHGREGEEAVLDQAREFVEKKDYAGALARYESLAKWLERDAGLLIEWARVYTYADRPDQAIALFERIARQHPDRAAALDKELNEQRFYRDLNRARKLVERSRYADALVLYEKQSGRLERDPGLLIEWARVYTYADRNEEAVSLFERAAARGAEHAAAVSNDLAEQRSFVTLQKARTLVEQKKMNEAIALYGQIPDVLDRDPGLLIEVARVHSYADRHKEAIELFERVRSRHPEQFPLFVRELGDMYTWDRRLVAAAQTYRDGLARNPDDVPSRLGLARAFGWLGLHRESLAEYDRVLKDHPDSVPAMIGKADTLSWMDDLEGASDLLDRARAVDPANVDAMNLQARILVWNGLHRRGEDLYRQVMELYTNSFDAAEGLAFALYWDGREGESETVLRDLLRAQPARAEANKLAHELRDVREPYVSPSGDWSDDSNDRRIFRATAAAGKLVTPALKVEGFYEWMFMDEPDSAESDLVESEYRVDRAGVGLDWRLGAPFRLVGRAGRFYCFETDWSDVTGDGRLEWMPGDRFRLSAGWEQDYLRDGDAIENRLLARGWNAGAKYRHDRRFAGSVSARRLNYTDDNRQDSALGTFEYRFRARPYTKLYYNYHWARWDAEAEDYFSIDRFRAHTLGLFASWKMSSRWSLFGQGSLGYEIQEEAEDGRAGETKRLRNWFAAGGVRYRPSPRWSVDARVERFESRAIEGDADDGYSRTRVTLGIVCALGRESEDGGEPAPVGVPAPEER